MDRWRRGLRSCVLSLAFALTAAACHVTPESDAPIGTEAPRLEIEALNWIGEDVDPVTHLSQQPATCLSDREDPAVMRGALLFESPFLLGGQAAKSGISCAACHRNGRGNPDFFLTGISGPPGTADVTNGIFSKNRADNMFNPVPIPDLASPNGKTRVDRTMAGILEDFLSLQIIEEFDGSAPNPAVVADLATYVRALDHHHCAPEASEPQTWRYELSLLQTASAYINARDLAPSNAYVDAMRAALGRLNARYQAPQSQAVRDQLLAMSIKLADYPSTRLTSREIADLEDLLQAHEAQSFYREANLAAAFE